MYNNFNKLSFLGFSKIHEPQKNYDKIFLYKKNYNLNKNFFKKNNIFIKLKYTIIYLIKKTVPNFLYKKRLEIFKYNKEIKINLIKKLNKDLNINLNDNKVIDYLKFLQI